VSIKVRLRRHSYYFSDSLSRHLDEYIECDDKGTLIPRRRHYLFEDLHIPIPMAVTAVVFLVALFIGCSLLWFYRRPLLVHLGKLGMTLLVLGLALLSLVFVLNIALMVSRLLLF
jgi:hypothetical protein